MPGFSGAQNPDYIFPTPTRATLGFSFFFLTALTSSSPHSLWTLFSTHVSSLETKVKSNASLNMAALGSELGNAVMLDKIDKLRELNVGSLIPLPQVAPPTHGRHESKEQRQVLQREVKNLEAALKVLRA